MSNIRVMGRVVDVWGNSRDVEERTELTNDFKPGDRVRVKSRVGTFTVLSVDRRWLEILPNDWESHENCEYVGKGDGCFKKGYW